MLWIIQLVLPLTLLLMVALRPASNSLAFTLQICGTAAILLALHLGGLWIMPPWWTVWILWALFILALWRARSISKQKGFGRIDYVIALFWAVILAAGGWVTAQALWARTPPAGEIAKLALPLHKGRYYVVSGGSRQFMNAHLRTLPRATAGQRGYWGQSYGVDIIATDRWGLLAAGITPVLAPCSGKVIRIHDGVTEGSAVDLASPTARAGNYALLRCGDFDVLLAHFRKGSLRVAPGDTIRQGLPIATLGNSGASDAAHLHIHAQRPGTDQAPFSGQPLPMRINGRYLVRGDRP